MEIREDTWLSERFGHRVFTVPSAAALARGVPPGTYQARVDASDVQALAAFEAEGMRVVSVTVTLTADPAAPVPEGDCEVRDVERERDGAVADVAERSFRFSRFHLDPQVPDAVAARIKRDWVSSYLNGLRGEQLLVAVRGGEPVGFLAALSRTDGDRRVRVIDLVGVTPEARRSGAGTALVRRFQEDSVGRCDVVEVGTQLANVPALRFYERLGYVTARAAFDLHMHVR